MNESDYKRICAQPDVMRRSDIRATAALLQPHHSELAARVERLLQIAPVPKPLEHRGDSDADHLYLDLESDDLDEVVSALGDLEASLGEGDASATEISLAGDLLDRWNRAESSRPAV